MLTAFVPIWALTVLGYLVGRSGVLGDRAELVLGRLVFHVAMPAVLFTTLSLAGEALGLDGHLLLSTVLSMVTLSV